MDQTNIQTDNRTNFKNLDGYNINNGTTGKPINNRNKSEQQIYISDNATLKLSICEFRFYVWYMQNIQLYCRSKKKRNTPIYFNTNYRTEMKLVPINMD